MANSDRVRFLSRVRETVDDCIRLSQTDSADAEIRNNVSQRLISLQGNIEEASGNLVEEEVSRDLLSATSNILREIQTGYHNDAENTSDGYRTNRSMQGSCGAPTYEITKEQLQFLTRFNLTAIMMADVLQTSESTIRRRLRTHGIKLRDGRASPISNDDLDQNVREIIGTNRRIGPNSVRIRLSGIHITVSRQRVRDSCHRVDPGGPALRAVERRNIRRRRYRVAAPNSLWHIDGNHKLIRWQVVIHGAIDGFSRMITFLNASDNNRAATVMSLFSAASDRFGCPSRIRVDHGIENNDICRYMDDHRGLGRGSAIRGRSCHNQRIERLWVDVWDSVSNEYYDLFVFLEDRNVLDITNTAHLWMLHYIFLPRLNSSLQQFVHQYNNHNLSTEHSRTPNQLFIMGIMNNFHSSHCAIQQLAGLREVETPDAEPAVNDLNEYGAEGEDNGTGDEDADDASDTIQTLTCPLTAEVLANLHEEVDPLEMCGNVAHGLTLFRRCMTFL